jgi:chromosomal replication initiator protein
MTLRGSTTPSNPLRDEHRSLLDAVRRRVKRRQFETWFARTRLLRLSPTEVVVGVPNQFQLEWMTREYRATLGQAAREILGRVVEVRFEVFEADEPAATNGAVESGTPAPTEAAAPHGEPSGDAPAAARAAATFGAEARPSEPRSTDARPEPLRAPAAPAAAAPSRPARSPHQASPPPPSGATSAASSFDLPPVLLQPHYTFDDFVVGPSNQLPHAVARAVADHPGSENNPLFLYGSVGLGKTHLLQAICHAVLRRRPDCRIIYLSCEQFTNEYVSAVQRNSTEAFRGRFRSADMLVIDDIHFLANKERTQEEFFHTFNALYQQRKQIILSSDAAPTEIPTLEERLVSRFRWGVVAQLEQPEVETRMAIVRRKAEQTGLALPDDVVEFVATNVRSNIRELEGALASIRSRAALEKTTIDVALARAALEPLMRQDAVPVGLDRIVQIVAAHYGAKVSDLRSLKRTKSVSLPRQVAMHIARDETSLSLVEIGEFFGGRDHTTVLYAVEKISGRVASEEPFRATLEKLRDRIRAR